MAGRREPCDDGRVNDTMIDPADSDDLPESRLYTFVDEAREYALYFLEGQRLIRDLALLHSFRGGGFDYFRQTVLSIQPMIALMKHGEQLGFYIDSNDPSYRLKIETNHEGDTRCTLVPDNFSVFPEAVHGLVRVERRFPQGAPPYGTMRPPYQSFLAADGWPLKEMVNKVLSDSWQLPCRVLVTGRSDQSLMLHQLPALRSDDESRFSPEALTARLDGLSDQLEEVLGKALLDPDELVAAFQTLGFHPLASRGVRLRCSCSREGVIHSLLLIDDPMGLFDPGQQEIDVSCEYCKRRYAIGRADLSHPPDLVH